MLSCVCTDVPPSSAIQVKLNNSIGFINIKFYGCLIKVVPTKWIWLELNGPIHEKIDDFGRQTQAKEKLFDLPRFSHIGRTTLKPLNGDVSEVSPSGGRESFMKVCYNQLPWWWWGLVIDSCVLVGLAPDVVKVAHFFSELLRNKCPWMICFLRPTQPGEFPAASLCSRIRTSTTDTGGGGGQFGAGIWETAAKWCLI